MPPNGLYNRSSSSPSLSPFLTWDGRRGDGGTAVREVWLARAWTTGLLPLPPFFHSLPHVLPFPISHTFHTQHRRDQRRVFRPPISRIQPPLQRHQPLHPSQGENSRGVQEAGEERQEVSPTLSPTLSSPPHFPPPYTLSSPLHFPLPHTFPSPTHLPRPGVVLQDGWRYRHKECCGQAGPWRTMGGCPGLAAALPEQAQALLPV